MISSTEMVMKPTGEMKPLEDFISDNSGNKEIHIDTLYSNPQSTKETIILSKSYEDYDMIYFELIREADNNSYIYNEMYISELLVANDMLQFVTYYNDYITYQITDEKTLTYISSYSYGRAYIKRVVGIKF